VKITRGAGGPLKPKIMSTTNPLLSAELRETQSGESYDLVVTAKPPWPNGPLRATVQIETGVEQVPMESVTVTASILPRLRAVPSRLLIRPGGASGPRLAARLSWDSDQPGNAIEAKVTDPKLTVHLEKEKDRQVVVLDIPNDYKLEPGKGVLVTVKTDDPIVPVLQIPVDAVATPPGEPAATPAVAPGPQRPTAGVAGARPAGTQTK
jgi:hypothetical protein